MAQTAVPVACAVIERGGAFLAARRAPEQSNADLWEFPGGKVGPGETPEEALDRELREELDIRVAIRAALTPRDFAYSWMTITLVPFVCSLVEGEPSPREHAEIRWLRAAEARSLAWAGADLPVLEEYLHGKSEE